MYVLMQAVEVDPGQVTIPVSLSSIPVHIRGGSVVPMQTANMTTVKRSVCGYHMALIPPPSEIIPLLFPAVGGIHFLLWLLWMGVVKHLVRCLLMMEYLSQVLKMGSYCLSQHNRYNSNILAH